MPIDHFPLPADQLNVLHVVSDQHNAACVGAEGHPQAITPNIDGLAADGVLFTRAYANNTVCTPNRVSMLSGQYPHNHGYFSLIGPTPSNMPSYLGHFRERGYRTAGIGKLHAPDHPENWLDQHTDLLLEVYRRGNEGYGDNPGTNPYLDFLDEHGARDREDAAGMPEYPGLQQIEGRPSLLPYELSVEGWCVRRAIEFMDAGGPFCLQVSLPRPHQCFTPDKRFWDLYPDDLELPPTFDHDPSHRPPHFQAIVEYWRDQNGLIEPRDSLSLAQRVWHGYLGCVSQVDFALGELLDYLDQSGRARDTVVIYGTDHGGYSGTFGILEKAPGISSEAVCRVPLVVRAPGVSVAGTVCDQFVEHVDVAPTMTALCGLDPMESVDGLDITPLLRGDGSSVKDVAVTENMWSKALRWGQWRFVHYQPETYPGSDVGELYDLDSDPEETTNLYADPAHRETVESCRRLLLEWLIRTTRVTTFQQEPGASGWPARYPLAADGKRTTSAARATLEEEDRGFVYYV